MAKVSAHGAEIGTLYFTTSARRYMSDGHVLRNQGFGWKLYKKLERDSIQAAYESQLAKQTELLANRPMTRAYRKALHDMAGLSKRWKLHAAVETLAPDADGVWSEACDGYGDNISADIDEVGELCRLYQSAVDEQRAFKAQKEGV